MDSPPVVAVAAVAGELQDQAESIAQRLALPLLSASPEMAPRYVLEIGNDGLQLLQCEGGQSGSAPGPIRVDFLAGQQHHRRLYGGGKRQLIAKAVGLAKGIQPHVLDCTAGLGRDAFVLAGLGCYVTLLERHPVVHALLEDGLQRARSQADPALLEVLQRMTLLPLDARDYLAAFSKDGASNEG